MGILRTDKISGLETPTAVTGSVSFDGTGDYLSLADSNDFTLAKNDFTFECWLYATGDVTNRRFFGQINSGGSDSAVSIRMGFNGSDLLLASVYEGTTEKAITAGFIAEDRWYHIAFVRDGSTLRSFIDGVQQGTLSFTGTVNDSSNQMAIGRLGEFDGSYFTGHISNLRFLKGTALYTANFTPPTHELEVIGDTVLLCCNNPDSAGAEATGKAITVNGNAAASTFSPGLTRDFTFGTQFEGVSRFDTQGYFVPPSGTTEQRGRGRGVLGGGQNPGNVGTIDFVTIQSMGNSLDFGDLIQTGQQGGCSSSTRGLFANGSTNNTIDFITISTTGNAVDFGDRTVALNGVGALSSNTRGVFLGGGSPSPQSDVMDYVTIASIGDAIDFGNLTTANKNPAGCSSPVRGVIALGGSPGEVNTIDYITIATTGNALDFGDCTEVGEGRSAFSSSTRGIFTGSYSTPAVINVIQYVTIATTGNAQDFGDLVLARTEGAGTSDSIRGISFGGFTPGSPITPQNIIDYVTIASTGNAKDFGDLTQARQYPGACSDSHGGLS